jgi:hypothetical protein
MDRGATRTYVPALDGLVEGQPWLLGSRVAAQLHGAGDPPDKGDLADRPEEQHMRVIDFESG